MLFLGAAGHNVTNHMINGHDAAIQAIIHSLAPAFDVFMNVVHLNLAITLAYV